MLIFDAVLMASAVAAVVWAAYRDAHCDPTEGVDKDAWTR